MVTDIRRKKGFYSNKPVILFACRIDMATVELSSSAAISGPGCQVVFYVRVPVLTAGLVSVLYEVNKQI